MNTISLLIGVEIMIEIDLFITAVFFHVDNFCRENPPPLRPGPNPSLNESEAITLLIFSQWSRFRSERDFYRFADTQLRDAFPDLPSREQLNRQWRSLHDRVCVFFSYMADLLEADKALYEALDATAVVTRSSKRRGDGWLFHQADIGHSNRLGWYEGLKLLLATTPEGIITGFGMAPASEKEQPMAETFFYLRNHPDQRIASIGQTRSAQYYPVDKGFEGRENQARWKKEYGACIIYAPKRNSKKPWPKELRRWLASKRQIVETVFGKLIHTFRLDVERPHHIQGVRVRLAAKVALHNFCIWMNRQLGRPNLAFADLLGWS